MKNNDKIKEHESCGCGHDHEHEHDSCGCGCGCGHDHGKEKTAKDYFFLITGIVLFVVGFAFSHISALDKLIAQDISKFAYPILFGISWLCVGYEIGWHALKGIAKGQIFGEDFLMTIASVGAFFIGEYPEAVAVILFFRVGEYLEHKASDSSRDSIADAVDMRPETAILVDGDETKEVPAGEVKVDDIILIRPGDRIALDGTVVEGESHIDTSPVTGESVPVDANVGSELLSGCMNLDGLIKIKVTKPLEESMVTRILESTLNAANNKPKMDRFITRFSKIYTPIVCLIALVVAIVPSLITGEWSHYVYSALTFLVISCPCALVISVPLSFFVGIGKASSLGILLKGGYVMETLNEIDAVVMDKTGTITKGNFEVSKIVANDEDKLIRYAASIESNSTHPIAKSIVEYAAQRGIVVADVLDSKELAGNGLSGTIDGHSILCGNYDFLINNGIEINEKVHDFASAVYISEDGDYIGALILSDVLKPTSVDAINKIKKNGIRTFMLTGDNKDAASKIADEAGIDEFYSNLLPTEKLDYMQKIRKENGKVLFVGDGINDAPVLAGADVGAAMGSGADAAIEAADVVFMSSDLMAIPKALSISKKILRIAKENISFALIIKLAIMVLSYFGIANMWLAVFADTGVALLCILNCKIQGSMIK